MASSHHPIPIHIIPFPVPLYIICIRRQWIIAEEAMNGRRWMAGEVSLWASSFSSFYCWFCRQTTNLAVEDGSGKHWPCLILTFFFSVLMSVVFAIPSHLSLFIFIFIFPSPSFPFSWENTQAIYYGSDCFIAQLLQQQQTELFPAVCVPFLHSSTYHQSSANGHCWTDAAAAVDRWNLIYLCWPPPPHWREVEDEVSGRVGREGAGAGNGNEDEDWNEDVVEGDEDSGNDGGDGGDGSGAAGMMRTFWWYLLCSNCCSFRSRTWWGKISGLCCCFCC